MHFHSLDDPRALYYGGLGPPFPFTNIRNMHPAVEDVVEHWARLNKCSMAPPIVAELILGVLGTLNEGHSATRCAYQGCDADVEVVLWKLTGAGHVWPGGEEGYVEDLLGPSTSIVDANERMWAFFSRYQLETIPQ